MQFSRILEWVAFPFSRGSLIQGIFQTQGSNPGLPHWRWILYQLSCKGSPRTLQWVANPFSRGIFLTQELNRGLLHCRWILYQLSYQGSWDERDVGVIPGSGRSLGGGNGNPLQCSCLENSIERGAWWTTVHRAAKSMTWLTTHTHSIIFQSLYFLWWTGLLKTDPLYFDCLLPQGSYVKDSPSAHPLSLRHWPSDAKSPLSFISENIRTNMSKALCDLLESLALLEFWRWMYRLRF